MSAAVAAGLPDERQGFPAPPDLAARRATTLAAMVDKMRSLEPAPAQAMLGGRRALVFRATSRSRLRIVHFHGGGFRQGCPEVVAGYAQALSLAAEAEVICPTYRLAPDHPFPAAINDALAVLTAVSAQDDLPLVLAGDSVGGNIAAVTAARATAQGAALAGLILHSPWLDLTLTAQGYERNRSSDPLFSRETASDCAALYLQGHPAQDPLASPLLGPLATLPPTLLTYGEGEVLADDSRAYADRLSAAGIRTTVCPIPGMEHVAVARDLSLVGAREAFAATVGFIGTLIPG